MLLFGIVIMSTGCAYQPYRMDLPTTENFKRTEIITDEQGRSQKKEVIEERRLLEPAEKYQQRYYGGYNNRYNNSVPYYRQGRNAVRICIFGCDNNRRNRRNRNNW